MVYRTVYWSDIGSNPPKIKKASMDGSGVRTVVLLSNTNVVYTFVFTLDYSQQMLYWINGSDNCYYSHYIESSSVDGSGRRIAYDTSYHGNPCYYGYYHQTQAIDFFRGAVYSYSKSRRRIYKTVVEHTPNIYTFDSVGNYMCSVSYMYSGMKVISPECQQQGIYKVHIAHTKSNNYATNCRNKSLYCQQWWLCSSLSSQQ